MSGDDPVLAALARLEAKMDERFEKIDDRFMPQTVIRQVNRLQNEVEALRKRPA